MLGILCGLESEAKIARQIEGAIIACAAARPRKARELARELVTKGATKLMSFGIAGSLDSSVHLGDIFIGTRVVSQRGRWACDEVWGHELVSKISYAKRGSVYGSEVLVPHSSQKEELFHATGCAIVDMESQCAAEVAAEAKIPLMVVRAVCDDAAMNVPPFVMAAIKEDGSIDVSRALLHLARHPLQAGDLIKVLHGTGKALAALRSLKGAI
jgi:adenosylhomocysteine nucleosidase